MNRNDELIELKKELNKLPIKLSTLAPRAISRAKKQKRITVLWKTSMVSLCMASLIFILIVNLVPSAAYAMSKVPFIKELVLAVSLDPSLKRAVENDYYQTIKKHQTKDETTVTIDYMILDAGHISIFFHVDTPLKEGSFEPRLKDPDGNGLPVPIAYSGIYKSGEIQQVEIEILESSYSLPSELILDLKIDHNTFTFNLRPNKRFSQTKNVNLIQEWITINSQRIFFDRLEIYPTKARLFLSYDEKNTSIVKDLDIHFQDNKGNIYDPATGWIGGSFDSNNNISTKDYESSYFTNAKGLTLFINGISMIDKGKQFGKIDYKNKTITNLPKGITVTSMNMEGRNLNIELTSLPGYKNTRNSPISMNYYDMDGTTYAMGITFGSDGKTNRVGFTINDYKDQQYKIMWSYPSMEKINPAIQLNIPYTNTEY